MRLVGTVFRAHHPRWSFAPESGEGAALHGGRFNRPGVHALYTSTRMETAWLEAQQGFPFKAQPLTLCGYDVDCEDIADLTDPAVCAALGVAPADLACAWEYLVDLGQAPPTWTLADRLIASGHSGVKVRSFAHGATERDINVVFWQWTPAPPHRVQVVDDLGRLPRNDLSWKE